MQEGRAPKEGAGHDWWFAEGVPEEEGQGTKGVVMGVAGPSPRARFICFRRRFCPPPALPAAI